MISEFRRNNIDNKNVKYIKRSVKEGADTAAYMLHAIADDFDLILAGRRHDNNSQVLIGLSEWNEVEDLGVIGDDFLVSSDFHSKASVMVIQQQASVMTRDFSEDAISIGAFHAMAKGVLTLNSAGNSGPGLTASVAPWLMSVAASTTDRLFVDKVALGNGKAISEEDFRWYKGKKFLNHVKNFPLRCVNGSLVKGKIVICLSFKNYPEVRKAGAAGSVLLNNEFDKVCFVVSLPAVAVTQDSFSILISYKESTKTPVAEILKTEAVKDFDAPVVVGFSLRGPNAIVPEILKPDISAPGVDILAAFSPLAQA
ncbi:subtilisin-like protease SBT4.4 [Citrus sinensis]|nr:subtilisin-like protease SBT4.4 [Citrus sinensis]